VRENYTWHDHIRVLKLMKIMGHLNQNRELLYLLSGIRMNMRINIKANIPGIVNTIPEGVMLVDAAKTRQPEEVKAAINVGI